VCEDAATDGSVPVDCGHEGEHDDQDPVHDVQRAADIDAEGACDRRNEITDQRDQDDDRERRDELTEVFRYHGANDAEQNDDECRCDECSDNTGVRVLGEHGAQEEPERSSDQDVSEKGKPRSVAPDSDCGATHRDEEDGDRGRDDLAVAGELIAFRELREPHGGHDAQRDIARHHDAEERLAHLLSLVGGHWPVPHC